MTTTSQIEREPRQAAGPLVRRRWFPAAALVASMVLAVVVYAILGAKQEIPDLLPDELTYAKLSQSFAYGHGLTWRGSGTGLPPLWPILLAPVWHIGSVPDGYAAGKLIGTIVAVSAAIPTWLLGRELVGPRLALIPAVLSLVGTWMGVTAFLASENLAYPLAVAALAATVMAVRDTRGRWLAISLAFGILASLGRLQMLVLPVILVLSLAIDVVRQPTGTRRDRIAARPRWLSGGLAAIVVAGLAAFVVKPDLTHYEVLAHHASIGDVAKTTAQHGVVAIVMFAFIPVASAIALMARAQNWRDDDVGPLLVTLTAAVVVMFPVIGRFEAWATNGSPVERYVMYLAPLVLLAPVVAYRRVSRRDALISAGIVGLLLLALPEFRNAVEQPALYGVQRHVGSVALFGFALAFAGMWALSSDRHRQTGLAAAASLTAAVMVMQAWTSRAHEIDHVKGNRTTYLPRQLDWVDSRTGDRAVGLLLAGKNGSIKNDVDVDTEFFNRNVRNIYSTIDTGSCLVVFGREGLATARSANCRRWPSDWVLANGPYKLTLRGQRVVARTAHLGTLVRIPPGTPRLLSVVQPPCSDYGCTGSLKVGTYLAEPARVSVTFGPAPTPHRIQLGATIRTLPAGRASTLSFDLPKGAQAAEIPVDWRTSEQKPGLVAVSAKTPTATWRLW
ncbi:MAG TPA: hypothetical protein VH247_03770 [Thermoleophilaceae bacterium]|nr:hypothetical protein [Thermoleophilaceae bacterium]